MNAVGTCHRGLGVVGLATIVTALGCGAGATERPENLEGDEMGTVEQALNSSCGTFTPQATYTGTPPDQTVSAATQSAGCQGNSFIFDVNNWLGSSWTGIALAPTDFPEDETTCEATDIRLYVWEKSGGTVTLLSSDIAAGDWLGAFGCDFPISNAEFALSGTHSYRIGISARRPGSTNRAIDMGPIPVIH